MHSILRHKSRKVPGETRKCSRTSSNVRRVGVVMALPALLWGLATTRLEIRNS